jgi:MFS family permease
MTTTVPSSRTRDVARPPRHAAWALLAVCLGYFMVLLDGSALNIALPSIQREVHGSLATLQWLVNIYTIMLASLLLTAGAMADRIGSRKVFMASLAAFAATSLACGLSPNLGTLLAVRALQGVAAAGMLPTTLAIIARTYPDLADRARAITAWGATGGIALVVGPIGGGALTQLLGWRSIFLVNVPVGLFALWLSWRFTDETERRVTRSFDFAGQVTIIAGLAFTVAALIEGGARGWTDAYTLLPATAGLIALTVFWSWSGARRRRCCRSGCSAGAPSPRPSPRGAPTSRAPSASSSSSPSSSSRSGVTPPPGPAPSCSPSRSS